MKRQTKLKLFVSWHKYLLKEDSDKKMICERYGRERERGGEGGRETEEER